jgi:hypothetical protein|eukprot:COSAG01_NODE_16359_length_1242_cov_8.299213_2_plen_206_part_00
MTAAETLFSPAFQVSRTAIWEMGVSACFYTPSHPHTPTPPQPVIPGSFVAVLTDAAPVAGAEGGTSTTTAREGCAAAGEWMAGGATASKVGRQARAVPCAGCGETVLLKRKPQGATCVVHCLACKSRRAAKRTLLHEAVQVLNNFQWVAVPEPSRQPRRHIPRPEVKVALFWVCHSSTLSLSIHERVRSLKKLTFATPKELIDLH